MTTADDVILMTFYQLVGGEWGGGSGGGDAINKQRMGDALLKNIITFQ